MHGPKRRLLPEALALKAAGLSARQIAEEMGVNVRTVWRYLAAPNAPKFDPLRLTWFHNPTREDPHPRVAQENAYASLVRAAVAAGYDPRELALAALEALKR